MAVKGYKVFDKNWKCRGFQYEIGKTYRHDGEIEICSAGFHFCENLINCFDFYPFKEETKVAEIVALGDIKSDGTKSVTNIIEIVRELTWSEVLNIVNLGLYNNGYGNTGDHNTGKFNTGNYNTGDHNAGDCNIGDQNTGYNNTGHRNTGAHNTGDHNTGRYNTGDFNSGHCNTGDHNTGRYNTGDGNTGDHNTGNCNTGMWNHTSYSSGYFNTCESPLIVFNQPVNMTRDDFLKLLGVRLLYNYVYKYRMDATKAQKWYESLSLQSKKAIKDIPNFNTEIFKQITGIDVEYSN